MQSIQKTKTIAKWLTGTAMGAALLFTPHTAHAQVSFGVHIGGYPAYGYAQPYGYRDLRQQEYFEHERHEQIEAARAAEWRHEQFEHQRFYDRDRGYDHDGWRGDDHDRHDRY